MLDISKKKEEKSEKLPSEPFKKLLWFGADYRDVNPVPISHTVCDLAAEPSRPIRKYLLVDVVKDRGENASEPRATETPADDKQGHDETSMQVIHSVNVEKNRQSL